MPPKNQPPDSSISKNVSRALASCGLRAPCQIRVQTRKGQVTLAGHVIYPHQKAAAVQAIQKIEGVLRVTDQLKVRPPVKHDYKTLPPLPKPAAQAPAEDAEAKQAAPDGGADAAAAAPPAQSAPVSEPENLSDSTEFDLGPAPLIAQPRERAAGE